MVGVRTRLERGLCITGGGGEGEEIGWLWYKMCPLIQTYVISFYQWLLLSPIAWSKLIKKTSKKYKDLKQICLVWFIYAIWQTSRISISFQTVGPTAVDEENPSPNARVFNWEICIKHHWSSWTEMWGLIVKANEPSTLKDANFPPGAVFHKIHIVLSSATFSLTSLSG